MANMTRTNGTVAMASRFVAEAINHPVRGKVALVRDNYPTEADEYGAKLPRVIVRRAADAGYVPALRAAGWKLTGTWIRRADGSFAATCEPA